MIKTLFLEKELIEQCRKGSREAQQVLYNQYAPKLMGVCMRYLTEPEDAKDIVQEVFFKVFTRIDDFRGESRFETWLTRILINHTLNWLRKNKKRLLQVNIEETDITEILPDEPGELLWADWLTPEEAVKMISSLPVQQRTVLNLYVFEQFSHAEIASQLGISESTSRVTLLRARAKLNSMVRQKRKYDEQEDEKIIG